MVKVKAGIFYGVGVGPGDPELLTIKAVRVLEGALCVAVPKSKGDGESVALEIVEKAVGLEGKEVLELVLPMTRDEVALSAARQEAATLIARRLASGTDVAFITLGDPLFYSTFSYLAAAVTEASGGAEVVTIPGVSSVSAAAAATGGAIAEGSERVTVVPALYEVSEARELLKQGGTVVFMKVKSVLDELVDVIVEEGAADRAVFVSRAGWPEEEIVRDVRTLKGKKADYFSIIIIRG
jgi:precorrin-2/cobalt-factor-2 C20-methyltransferase